MKINKYENFILESVFNELLLEANIVYKKEFLDTINDLKTGFPNPVEKICDFLLDVAGKDLDITQNYIGLSDEVDKISFIPEDKIGNADIKLLPGTVVNAGGEKLHEIQKDAKLPIEGMIWTQPENFLENNIINSWKLIKTINMAIVPDTSFNQYTLYYLQNNEDPTKFITTYKYSDNPIPFEYELNSNSKLKIGRYINRLLDLYLGPDPIERRRYTASDVEKFVNKFISAMEYQQNALDHFRIVTGDKEIKHWYLESNYAGMTGQLGQSCMKYIRCQDYFNIYIENPDVCQLLIFTDSNDKLLGRALLWKLIDGSNYMDRIYTTRDSYIDLFNQWGKENGYTKHYEKNSSNKLSVEIKPKDYGLYPYMDTFKYFKLYTGFQGTMAEAPKHGLLTNNVNTIEKPFLELENTLGQALRRFEDEPSRTANDM
jgi:hypothetical protein